MHERYDGGKRFEITNNRTSDNRLVSDGSHRPMV